MRPAQEQDTDTPSVTGRPAPQTIKNPENRPFMTWLTSPARKDDVLLLVLNGCKRCGPEVCKSVAALLPQFCPKLYASPEAPETRLTHTFYDCPWTQVTPPGAEPSSALFNEVLFATLADQILKHIIDARDSGKQHSMPLVLVLTYLHRHAAALEKTGCNLPGHACEGIDCAF